MDFAGGSDRLVLAAWATGAAALLATLALVLQVVRRRRALGVRVRRRARAAATWRPLLFEAIVGGRPALPPLAPEDEESFLLLWNQLQDGVRGEARERLVAVADAVGAHAFALRRLGEPDALGRVLALRTLGYLGRPGDEALLVPWLDDPRAYLSLAAARALVHAAPARAVEELLPRLARRGDWPVPLFASVLAEADPAALAARFEALCAVADGPLLVRLLPLVSILDPRAAEAVLSRALASSDDPEVLGAALKRARTAALLPAARRACGHASWAVRTQAAAALGRVGEPGDRFLLVGLLSDAQWWVRYRAAQALASGRFGAAPEVTALAAALDDRFARDIVAHALAEGRA